MTCALFMKSHGVCEVQSLRFIFCHINEFHFIIYSYFHSHTHFTTIDLDIYFLCAIKANKTLYLYSDRIKALTLT